MDTDNNILAVEGLIVSFKDRHTVVTAVHDVAFTVRRGKTFALVGESGSGKSVTSLALMGLLPDNAEVMAQRMQFHPDPILPPLDLDQMTSGGLRDLRGVHISMIFQEPMSSLNPLYPIGDQIGEMLQIHGEGNARTRKKRVIEMLEMVEIPAAGQRYHAWPHELSGGMRQRAMIALALVCNPSLLIADEPTTALDVTIQAQILDLMRRLQTELDMSILFITHDLGVVAEMADDVAVMYAGQVQEQTTVGDLFASSCHPYTQGLLSSIPRHGKGQGDRPVSIPGSGPALHAMPPGCSCAPRCSRVTADGRTGPIPLNENGPGHHSRCIRADGA